MGRGDRTIGCKNSSEGRVSKRKVKNDDSDEDYMLEEDAADDLSDELESLVGDSSDEESLDCFVDNDNEEVVQKIMRSNIRTRNSKKRKRTYDDKNNQDYNDEDDDDDDDDGVDDDDEFSPEELDFSDEEELPSPTGNYRIQARRSPKKKGYVKSQKRKTGSRLRPHKKKRKGRSKSGKRKRMPTSKKKKPMSRYDSDFASSESSDHEFTISEEEREQVREASDLCTRLTSNLRSSKKDQEDTSHYQPRRLSRRKGKAKVEEKKTTVEKQVCGICFTEEGKITVSGTLNCCSHFFCYACIIQWSKVESRCPLCKQRFCTISKPAGSATTSDVVIHIPERDQVYQPSEEEIREYFNLYENLMCTECHEGGDDYLMLLCDICDSPAHTYCVGLDREVPEGNWYCEGCRPTAVDFTSLQAQDLMPIQSASNSAVIEEPSTFENIAEIDLNITIPEIPMNPVNGFLVSPRGPLVGGVQASSSVSGMGGSTLSGRRGFQHLQYLLSRLRHMDTRMDRSNLDTR